MTEAGVPDRRRARALASESIAGGDAVGWFERLYAEADDGSAVVPWADLEANPLLVRALERLPGGGNPWGGGRAIVVGCGYGDDAAHLAGLGWHVTAFDVSPTSVARAAERWRDLDTSVQWETCDVLEPFRGWLGAFDLVAEVYTVQVLPPGSGERARSITAIASLTAPGGRLVVVARAREDDAPEGEMPWPLTRAEVESFADSATGLVTKSVEIELDHGEDPPVSRWVGVFSRT